jgi:hypothetical protein
MRLVHSKRPALLLENVSDVVATQIKCSLALMKIGGPNSGQPAQIPITTFDFIKEREKGGPQNLFDPPQIIHPVDQGQKLFGWIQISCPMCVRTHYYWAYIQLGYGGWYSEVSKERHEAIVKWLHENGPYNDSDIDRILSVIGLSERNEIQDE